jgi:alkylhydroperoxidase family enzyme
MARIPPLDYENAPPEARAAHDQHQGEVGRITNMKRTLLHSLPAFHALMEWYPLRDTVRPFLGERLTHLFAHAVSTETDCLICSTFFRRLLLESGEDPDALVLSERERVVVDFGRQLGRDAHGVSDAMYADLARLFTQEQIVALTAFGVIMLATNVFNNALRVDLDGYLEPYRAGTGSSGGAQGSGAAASGRPARAR